MASSSTAASMMDLPVEILEMIASYLPATTISALRYVNRRLNLVFDHEMYWKQSSLYPKKYFLCDIRSNSTAPGIQEVVAVISRGNIGEWKGYIRLQQAHIWNWTSGQVHNRDRIPVSPATVEYVEETVNDQHEHLLLFSVGNSIELWDITAEPRALESVQVGQHRRSSPRFLPQRNLLVEEFCLPSFGSVMAVYRCEPQVQIRYKFVYDMNEVLPPNTLPHDGLQSSFCYIVMEDRFIGFSGRLAPFRERLHIWDLSSGTKLAKVHLAKYDVMRAFVEFVKSETPDKRDILHDACSFKVDLYPGEFPKMILVFCYHYDDSGLSQVNVFDVETMQFTSLVDQLSTHVIYCSMYRDKICAKGSIYLGDHCGQTAFIYTIHKKPLRCVPSYCDEPAEGVPVHGELLKYLGPPKTETASTFVYHNFFFKHSKVLINSGREMQVIDLDSIPLEQHQFEIDAYLTILGFVEPSFLLMHDLRFRHSQPDIVVYNTWTGKQLFTWRKVNISRFIDYFRGVKYLSKFVLSFKGEREFKVYNF